MFSKYFITGIVEFSTFDMENIFCPKSAVGAPEKLCRSISFYPEE
jgi:hypothetical protein